ncbi:hypothetical protein TNIN_447711 [Trichonephila inaurata madagascariensis]|uniref:Uncharacterized protein n=1 Tax=Trichonephila inaurata madagascariensis TaxID=2747483 RepID=A0A8X6IG82_9ARAC|nr:hypothetical protein TNIN_447711 [Trichonephila inaurata madagascariensis]
MERPVWDTIACGRVCRTLPYEFQCHHVLQLFPAEIFIFQPGACCWDYFCFRIWPERKRNMFITVKGILLHLSELINGKDFCPRLQLTTTKGLWIFLCPPHLILHDLERPRNMLPDPRTAAS